MRALIVEEIEKIGGHVLLHQEPALLPVVLSAVLLVAGLALAIVAIRRKRKMLFLPSALALALAWVSLRFWTTATHEFDPGGGRLVMRRTPPLWPATQRDIPLADIQRLREVGGRLEFITTSGEVVIVFDGERREAVEAENEVSDLLQRAVER